MNVATKKQFVSIIKIILGNILMGIAYAKWMVPHTILNGGVTSLSMVVQKVSHWPLVWITNGLTLILLICCLIFLGKENFFKSLLSSLCYTSLFALFYSLDFSLEMNIVVDFILATLFIAVGYYLCISANASTVGMDVVALILHKRNPKIKIAKTIRLINYGVLVLGLLTYGIWSVVIGLIFSFAYSYLLNLMLEADSKYHLAHDTDG